MITLPEVLLRLIVAMLLGALIGWERESSEHSAGLRTNALVAMGTALFTIISGFGFMPLLAYPHISLDPTRIASYIIAGIGFLGGGTIMMRRDAKGVRGLTTAATIWVVAAIGMACGVGMLVEAILTTLLTFFVLIGLRYIEAYLLSHGTRHQQMIIVHLASATSQGVKAGVSVSENPIDTALGTIYRILEKAHIDVERINIQAEEEKDNEKEDVLEIVCRCSEKHALILVVNEIKVLPNVQSVDARLRKGIMG